MKKIHLIVDVDHTSFDTHGKRSLYSEVEDVFKELIKSCEITLLTVGDPEVQKNKVLCLLSIVKNLLIVSEPDNKLAMLKQIKEADEKIGRVTIVIGDRLDIEIRAANEIGLHSVHVRRGKYKDRVPRDFLEQPTLGTVSSLSELSLILAMLQKQNKT